ncbi:MAG TPA: Ig-like domain-containing protein [Longimicrobium sp.]|nr:Ig-like domain-containing protein [Longimicrobium sp.]
MRLCHRSLAALLAAGWILAGCDSPTQTRPDATAPSVQVQSPAPGSTVTTATATLSGTAADSAGVARVTVQVNGGAEAAVAVTPGTSVAFTVTVPLAPGQNTIVFYAYDAAGNRGTATVTLTRATPTPALVGLSIDPDSVDARAAAGSAQLTFRVTSASLVTQVAAVLVSESGAQLGCSATTPVSIDAAGVGTFRCTIPIPTSTRGGTYTATSVTVNQAAYTTAQLQAAGYETRLAVAANPPPGEQRPVPVSLTFAPDPVVVTGPSVSVTFTVRATDSTGVGGMYIFLISPQGGEVGRCSTTAPGTPPDATLQCSIPFANSASLQPGTLRVWLGLYDARGFYQLYNADALAARGFDSTLQVEVDTTPPTLAGFDLVPDSVDVRTSAALVDAVFRVSHGYRADRVSVTLANDAGNALDCEATARTTDASGVQVFRCTLSLSPNTPTGPYTVTQVVLFSRTSTGETSTTAYGRASLADAGFDTVLKVVSPRAADTTAPTVIGLSFAPDPVQVTGAQATVTFDVRLSDPGAGATAIYVFLLQNGAEARRCSSNTLLSGTPADGTFRCTITFVNSASLQPGSYGVSIQAHDANGNFATYSPAQLAAAGFDSSLELQVDTTPPRLVGFAFTPDSVDVRTQAAVVTFTFQATNGYRVPGVSVTLQNEGGETMTCEATRPASTDGSGVSTFTCTIFVSPQRGAGTYMVTSVRVGQTSYTTPDLQTFGFPTRLKVVSNTVTDISPPAVVSLSFAPDPLHLSGGNQSVAFSARLTDLSGTDVVIFFLIRPNVNEYGRCTATAPATGTRTDGTFQCSIPVSGSAAATPTGTYRVAMSVFDVRGNMRYLTPDQLAAQGFDSSLEVQP